MPIIFTNAGQAVAADLWDPATRSGVPVSFHGGWGADATAPTVADTALGVENPEARDECTISQPAADTVRHVFTITATGNRVVNEFGIFTAAAAGDMPIRGTLSTLNIETGDRVEFTVDLTYADASEV